MSEFNNCVVRVDGLEIAEMYIPPKTMNNFNDKQKARYELAKHYGIAMDGLTIALKNKK